MNRIGPGMLLAGRYRLEEQVAADPLTATWRAQDLTLERTVAVRVLSPTHSRVQATLDAARRAVLVDDPRLQRVLGVGTEAGSGFVVLEWVDGKTIGELAGAVDEDEAVRVVREATEGLLAAAARHLHHGHLGPDTVLRAPDDRVRITGLAIDAAAAGGGSGEDAAEEESRDVRDLGALLYALLTSCWPFGYRGGLLAAPTERGRPLPPASLLPGTSPEVSRLTHAVVLGNGPQDLAHLLHALAELDGSVPAVPGPGSSTASPDDDTDDDTDELVPVPPRPASTGEGSSPAQPTTAVTAGAGATAAGAAAGPAAAGAAAAGPPVVALPDTDAARSAGPAPTPAPGATSSPARAADRVPRSAYASTARPFPPPATDDGWSLLPVEDPYAQQYDTYYEVDPGYADDGYTDASSRDPAPPAAAVGHGGAAVVLPSGAGRADRGRRASGAGTGVAVVLVVAAFVVSGLVWALDRVTADVPSADPPPVVEQEPAPSEEPAPEPSAPAAGPEPSEPELRLITPAGAQALDPQGDGAENDQEAPRAIDRDPATYWSTERYDTQDFGGLKEGVGLVLDLGAPEDVTAVEVLATGPGGSYEVRTASSPSIEGSAVVGTGGTGPEPVSVVPEAPVQTRFLVVWFTTLPDNGEWRGQLNEVQVQVQ